MNSNSFLHTLQRHRSGGLLDDASARLAEVVAAVRQTGKPGSVTVKLEIKPAQVGADAVVLTDEIKAKVPRMQATASFWFATDDGALVTTDPRQRELEFTPVPVPAPVPVPQAVNQ